MGKSLYRGLLLAVALLMMGAGAFADTVILRSGKKISGRATPSSDSVMIVSKDGTLTVPLWRVSKIVRSNPGTEEVVRVAVRRGASASYPRRNAVRRALPRNDGVKKTIEALNRKVSVDFVEMPLRQAISYLQEITGANFAAGASVDDPGVQPVTLVLRDVRVGQILDLMLQPVGMKYVVTEGGIIRIDTPARISQYRLRVYDARDLLYDVSDSLGVATTGVRGGPRGAGANNEQGYVAAQWGGEEQWGQGSTIGRRGFGRGGTSGYGGYGYGTQGGYGGGRGGYGTYGESLRDRAESLGYLIATTVAPNTWVAVGGIGGAEESGYGGRGYGGYGGGAYGGGGYGGFGGYTYGGYGAGGAQGEVYGGQVGPGRWVR